MTNEQNVVRMVLKNEITWIVFIIAAVFGCVKEVILPIQALQFQIASLQSDISTIKGYDQRITQNTTDIIVLQDRLNLKSR